MRERPTPRFGILGPIELLGDDRPALGPLQRTLLAYLLVNAGSAVSGERMIEAVWPRSPAAGALKRLQVSVGRLRRLLPEDALQTVAGGYRLRVEPGDLDAAVFEAELAAGRRALEQGDPRRAAERLDEALGWWRGPALAEVTFADFAQPEIRRLEELRLVALESRIEAGLRTGRHAEQVGELESLVAAHPTRERLAGQLMLALYRCGRQAEALDAYQRTRMRLADELGLEPGPALRELQESVLRQAPELELAAAAAAAPAPPPSTGFYGRGATMAALHAARAAAAAGTTRVVALGGEPGVGKTRCATELAAAGGAVWARCAEDEGARAFWPWIQLLRGLRGADGDLGELTGIAPREGISPEEARFELFDAVVGELARAARERPVVAVLDDVQWADRSSLDLLVHLVRHLPRARLLIVATFRTADVRRGAPLAKALGELHREPGFERLELTGLGTEDVGRMLERETGEPSPAGLAAAVHRRTGGNPFYVGELARALTGADDPAAAVAAVPGGVREAVCRRLDRLPADAVDLLGTAAVIGRAFRLPTLARAAGIPRADAMTALEAPLAEQLVAADGAGGRHSFAHAIVRDVVYADLAPAARARRHAAVAAALEERSGTGSAELAHHALLAARGGQDAEPALRHLVAAAEAASAALAHAEAARLYEQALEAEELAEDADGARRARLLVSLARARALAGDLDEAERRYGEAADLARTAGAGDLLAEAALGYAEWQSYGVVDPRAIELLEEALETAPADGALRASLLGRLAGRLGMRDQQRRERLLAEAVETARRAGDDAVLTRMLALSPLVHWRPEQAPQRRRDAAETIRLAVAGGDPEPALWARMIRYVDALSLGEMAAADEELAAYQGAASQLHQPYYRWYGMVLRAGRALFGGELAEGERLATEAVELNRRHEPDSEQEYTVQRLTLALARGRPEDAAADRIREYAERYAGLSLWRALAARLAHELGEAAAARAAYAPLAAGGFAAVAGDPDRIATLALLAGPVAAAGDRAEIDAVYGLLLPYRARNVVIERGWAAWGSAERPLGVLAAARGEGEAAEAHHRMAAERDAAWGAHPWARERTEVHV